MDPSSSSLVLTAADSAALASSNDHAAELMPITLDSAADNDNDGAVDISDIAKQLMFSHVKDHDDDNDENRSNNEQSAVDSAAAEAAKPVAAAVIEEVVAAEPVVAAPSVLDLACSTPLPADDFETEIIAAAPAAPAPATPATAVAAAVIEDEDANGAAFPTFASAVDSDDLSYVSAEMKAQEMLLLEATQPAAAAAIKTKGIKAVTAVKTAATTSGASTPRSRSHSRSNSSSAASTPRSSSVQRSSSSQSSASSRLTAPTFSSSKRRAESVTRTPQSFAREVTSAMAAVALLTGAAGERKKQALVAGEAKRLTVASSPKLKTRVRSHSTTALSSEESELLRIRVERSALAKLAHHNARHLDSVLHGSEGVDSMLPVRSTKPLTQPQDIKLHTSGRPKVRVVAAAEEPLVEKKPTALAAGQLTQAKPFSFRTDARSRSSSVAPSPVASRATSRAASRSTSRAASRSVSRSGSRVGSRVGSRAGSPSRSTAASAAASTAAAAAATAFSFATSLRAAFKTAGLGDAAGSETPASARKARSASTAGAGASGLTQPKPFVLSTDSRLGAAAAAAASGSTPFVSLAAQAAGFLGRGNDRVVSAPAASAAQALTTPREFKFHTTARERSVVGAKAEEKHEKTAAPPSASAHRSLDSFRAPQLTQVQPFHLSEPSESQARPAREDKAALDVAALEKERAERKAKLLAAAKPAGSSTTIAQAPALAVLQRVPLKEPVAAVEPAAAAAAAAQDGSATPRLTAPQPFHLSTDARGASKSDAFQSRVEEDAARARAAAEFHARPMPVVESAAVFVPKVPARKILADLPPTLRSAALHQSSQAQFAAQLAAEQSHAAAARTFVAKPLPATILGSVSFVPKPSDKALTTPADVELSSSSRAAKRAAYEHEQAVRAEAAEKRRREAEALRAQEEAQKMKAFRQTLVHQAKPVPASSAGTKAPR